MNSNCLIISEAEAAGMNEATASFADQDEQETKETRGGSSFVVGHCATASLEYKRNDDGKFVLIICLLT